MALRDGVLSVGLAWCLEVWVFSTIDVGCGSLLFVDGSRTCVSF